MLSHGYGNWVTLCMRFSCCQRLQSTSRSGALKLHCSLQPTCWSAPPSLWQLGCRWWFLSTRLLCWRPLLSVPSQTASTSDTLRVGCWQSWIQWEWHSPWTWLSCSGASQRSAWQSNLGLFAADRKGAGRPDENRYKWVKQTILRNGVTAQSMPNLKTKYNLWLHLISVPFRCHA